MQEPAKKTSIEISESGIHTQTKPDNLVYLANGVSQVEIRCASFGYYYDKFFTIYLSNFELIIEDYISRKNTTINSMDIKNNLTQYVNTLFIDKTENIVYSEGKEPSWIK